jgi:ATP-dependent DNA helicase RecG
VHRNPNLMKMLYGYGYVEGYGDGLPMVRALFEEHLLRPPLPRFEEVPGSVIVTLYAADLSKLAGEALTAHWTEMGLNGRQIRALEYLTTAPSLSRQKYSELCQASVRTAARDLKGLLERGLVVQQGKGRGTRYVLVERRSDGT